MKSSRFIASCLISSIQLSKEKSNAHSLKQANQIQSVPLPLSQPGLYHLQYKERLIGSLEQMPSLSLSPPFSPVLRPELVFAAAPESPTIGIPHLLIID